MLREKKELVYTYIIECDGKRYKRHINQIIACEYTGELGTSERDKPNDTEGTNEEENDELRNEGNDINEPNNFVMMRDNESPQNHFVPLRATTNNIDK